MDNTSIDKLTKDILEKSKLELTNSDFNSVVMNNIRTEYHKQSVSINIKLYFLIFITFDAMIFSALKLMNISIAGINPAIKAFLPGISVSVQNGFSNIGHFVLIYFSLLAILIFAVNRILNSEYRVG